MRKFALIGLAAAALVSAPAMSFAQVGIEVGPGGVRVGPDYRRDRDYDRRDYDRRDYRGDRDRMYERRSAYDGCRMVETRRMTPNGEVIRRERRCN